MAKKAVAQTKPTATFNIIYIATWAIMPLIYVLFKEKVQDSGLYPRYMFLAISMLITAGLLFVKKTKPFPFTYALAAISAFVLWHFVGYSQAYSKAEFWTTFGRNTLMVGYLFITFQLLRNELLNFSAIVKGMIIFSLLSAFATLPEIGKALGGGNYMEDIYAVRVLFIHKNFLASALLMALPFVYLGTQNKDKGWRIAAIVALVISILEIALLRTRGVWLGFFAGIGVTLFALLLSKQTAKNQLKWIGIGAGGFALIIALIFLSGSNSEKLLNRANIDLRMVYWESCVHMAEENPITGVGAGNWNTNFPKYGLERFNKSVAEGETNIGRPHNDFLWVLSELGAPALLAWITFLTMLIILGFKLLKSQNIETRDAAQASIFAIVGFAVYGFGEFPLERAITYGILMLAAAHLLYLSEKENMGTKAIYTFSPKLINIKFISLVFITLVIFNGRLTGEGSAHKAVTAYEKQNPANMLKYGEAAQNTFFEIDIYNSPMQFFTGLGYLAQQKFPQAESEFKDGLAISPYHINTLFQLGNLYKYQRQFDKAIVEYNKAIAVSPAFYRAHLNKAEVYLLQDKNIEALRAVNRVSPEITFQKYQAVGVEALKRLAVMPDQIQLSDQQLLARKYVNNPDEMWRHYLQRMFTMSKNHQKEWLEN